MFCKNGVLRNFSNFTGKYLRQSHFFNKVAGLRRATVLKKETLTQVFSCEFCKKSFFYRTPPVAVSSKKRTCDYRLLKHLFKKITPKIYGNVTLKSVKSYIQQTYAGI